MFTVEYDKMHVALFQIGIIGGTGIDDPSILQDRASKSVETPFGKVRALRKRKQFVCLL